MGRRIGALEEARSDERPVRGDDPAREAGSGTLDRAGLDARRATELADALHDVQDPEIPISIVDMGLLGRSSVHARYG